jgi:hypothetical protein
MNSDNNNKIALLIDGDNAQPKFIEDILAEAGKHGKVTIRRIYGDWTNHRLGGWKNVLSKHAIRPMQKFAFSYGKNSTDTAMIIDAMDILHSKLVTGFCIASSDSDYTGLAQRIREEGIFVLGIGSGKSTNYAFINACDIFTYTENFAKENESEIVEKPVEETTPATSHQLVEAAEPINNNIVEPLTISKPTIENDTSFVKIEAPKLSGIKILGKIDLPENHITKNPINMKLISQAFNMVVQDNDMAYLGDIAAALRRLDPGFDHRTYGFQNMSSLFRSLKNYYTVHTNRNNDKIFIKEK